MKSRIILPLAVLGCLAVAATAYAAVVQQNTYTVTGAINGGKGASSKKPKPVAVKFDYTVGEANGLRPSPVLKYSIFFGGLKTNGSKFASCDINKLTDNGPSVCPKGSIMGSGRIINQVGVPNNLADKSLYCYLTLTLVNGKKANQFLLYLKGIQTDPDPQKNCVTPVAEPINAKFVKKSGGVALEFTVPSNLLHPAGLDNAVTNVQSSIKKVTTKDKKTGKKVGFFESTSCKKTQKIDVAFTQENDGSVGHAKTTVPCTK